ncbi:MULTISPECIES: helix-turn-helix domain-containing protein [unclassified Pseudoclavibacter]|uniref:helix-turn-helix domain-containing protein n=1 Tax=unclassified Pseudoclavibacter TaxID=2615177 RepID=UPI001BA49674|nr:helix-turn-helix domain-containing protein [Pseudoclavibacter sp. Marseille-Q4354]MBS3177194.1 helix-turn-helix domain-containing protein [Pseudoclavibacter sp. Marseille-Q4354]
MPQNLTVAQVAALLEVTPITVRRWIKRKKLPAKQLFGGNWRISRQELEGALDIAFTDEQIEAVKQA